MYKTTLCKVTAIGITLIAILALMPEIQAQINTPPGATIPFGSNPNYQGTHIFPTNLPTSGTYGSDQDAADAYNEWKANYVSSCGGTPEVFRVNFDTPSETVSEGIAYGMLLSAYAADKALFDGLWQYYKNNMNGNGAMNWKISGCSGTIGSGGATDAELDAALALIVADVQWPGSTAPHNYVTDATALINTIKNYEIQPTNATGPYQTNNGDNWGFGNNCRNPSYQSPAYYKVYGAFVPSQAAFWDNVTTAAYDLINANVHPTTGLVSNWSDPTGAPNSCNGPDEHGWDACRNPWRMGTDVSWFADPRAKTICNNLAAWVQGVGAPNLKGPIPQNGVGGSYHSPTFISTWAVGVMGSSSTYQATLNSVYSETVAIKDPLPFYFGNTLRAICLFNMTGNFWLPLDIDPGPIGPAITYNNPLDGDMVLVNTAVSISTTITDADGTISSVVMEIDGVPVATTNSGNNWDATWTPTMAGTYVITTTATDNDGQSTTSSITITVTDGSLPPIASFTASPSVGPPPLPVDFDASASYDQDGSTLTYSWDFGDGTVGTGVMPMHTYTAEGSYNVVLTVTDANGNTDTYSSSITVSLSACNLSVIYRTSDTSTGNANDNTIRMEYEVINNGTDPVNLSEVTFRYWYLTEGAATDLGWVDYALIGASNVTTTIVAMASPEADADHYLELGFSVAAGTLAPGASTGTIQARITKEDWSNWNELNDYSFFMNNNTFLEWDHITLYCNGVLSFGIEPIVEVCPNYLNVNDNGIGDGTYQAVLEVYSNGLVPATSTVLYKAENCVNLDNAFEVVQGADFEAKIEGCN